MQLKDIAALIDGEVIGDGEVKITGVSGISDAKEGDITYLVSTKWLKELKNSSASAVILKRYIEETKKPQIITKNPHYAFAKLLSNFYVKSHPYRGISTNASVSDKAHIGRNVTIYPLAYISDGVKIGDETIVYPGVFIGENSVIGNACLIYSNVTVRENVTIGSRVIIHAGAVVGSDGFGYVFEGGIHQKIPQVGGVTVGDDVEIGANVTIDRATTGNTIINKGTKIDNLIQIGHNVQLGENVILVAQVGIGGSSNIGDGVMIGGQAAIADHVTIESGTMIGARSGVIGKVSKGVYSGAPAICHKNWFKAIAIFPKLPELNKKVRELEEKVKTLSKQVEDKEAK